MSKSVIGSLRVNLGLDSAEFTRGLSQAQRKQGDFSNSLTRMESSAVKATRGITRALGGLAIAAAGAFSIGQLVQQISTFEASMSKVAAISGATESQLRALRDTARTLGATTEFSAAQAADGLGFLAMAGFNAKEALAAIPSVLDLATASGMDLASTADIASNIMSGFGIEAGNAANVSDVLAAASSRANTNVSQLGQAMSTVAPISAALGIGLEDTAAAIGVMSDAGIQGERAGTALRGILAALAGPTAAAQEALSNYGLTVKDVDPATNGLADVMQTLGERGLSTADAMTIFGREAASGALVLIDGAARVAEFGNELRNVDGAASDMANTMRDNLGGDLTTLQSTVSGLILAFGDAGLTDAIRGVIRFVTVLVGGITDLVNGVSAVAQMIANNISVFVGFGETQSATSKAVDNIVLSLADEVSAIAAVTQALPPGIELSRRAAEGKLREASAIYAKIEAARQEARQAVLSSSEFRSLGVEVDLANEALAENRNQAQRMAGGQFAPIPNEYRESIAQTAEVLRRARLEQEALLSGAEIETDAYEEAGRQIKRLEDALASATGDVVVMGDSLITLGDRGEVIFGDVETAANLATSAIGGAARGAMEDLDKAAEELGKTMSGPLSSGVGGVADAFGDLVMRGFSDFKSFTDSILSSFTDMIRQMVVAAARNRIMLSLGFGGSVAGTAASAGTGLMGSLSGMGGKLGALGTFGSSVGTGLSVVGSGFAAGGFSGAATAMGGAISGGLGMGGAAGLGTALGAAIPVIGAVALAFGALRKKTTELDSGIKVAVDGMTATVSTFSRTQTSRFFGLSRRTSTQTGAASAAIADPIQAAVTQMQTSVMDAAKALNVAGGAFDDFSYELNLSLKGLSEEQAMEKINGELSKMGDTFAALIPQINSMQELNAVMAQRFDLEGRLLQLQGDTAALRARELDGVHEYNIAVLEQIFALEDAMQAAQEASERAAAAAAAAMRVAEERFGLEGRLLQLQGDTVALRARELDGVSEVNRAILQQIFALEDAAEAARRAGEQAAAGNAAVQRTMDLFRSPLALNSDRFTDRFSATMQAAQDRRELVQQEAESAQLTELKLMRLALEELRRETRDMRLYGEGV
ncbi:MULTISPECIES: phage tail tape measure protein [unclassified Yoonia]|uniref:phage tail tape measure protein n=1 Tax=unclassified Yoonia TaxID=2629118 RepID=UPI002AFF83C8|nr:MULTISPECIES: phage tail tape measure protein [unclassified Yoonia]